MKLKKKICVVCNKENYIFSKGRCKACTPQKRLGNCSKSQSELLKEYKPKMRTFLDARKMCEVKLDGCTHFAQGVHHKKGKATKELYLDEKYWMASCNHCNGKIEEIGELAYELGFKIRRNQI